MNEISNLSNTEERPTSFSRGQKRARYMSQWESSLYQMNGSEPSYGLQHLFDVRLWQGQNSISSKRSATTVPSSKDSSMVTFRLEHRQGGALSSHQGEERILLFRSDCKGAIAKIIFSSTPATASPGDSNGDEVDCPESMAEAKIHVLDVKDIYRGHDFGGLLFSEALLALQHRYLSDTLENAESPDDQDRREITASFVRCQLDAEEDIRRHNKLVVFYERLGCIVKPKTRPQFLNNNDGETYRKVPMQIDLKVPDSTINGKLFCRQTFFKIKSLVGYPGGFLPVQLLGSNGKPGKVALCRGRQSCEQQRPYLYENWLMVEDGQGNVQFRTTHGRFLTVDQGGNCTGEEAPGDSSGHFSKFRLLRVSDGGQDGGSNDEEKTPLSWIDNGLWILLSPHRTFLNINPLTHNLEVSATPTFWKAGSRLLSLTCTLDSPTRRQHYRRSWIKQTEEYVQAAKKRHLGFCLAVMSLKEALDLIKACPGFPFLVDPASRRLSLRTVCYQTAEAARAAGHPDWIQFIALIHALGSVINCIDTRTAIESENDFDWTILCSSRILGCPCPDKATFAEFRNLNADHKCGRFKSQNGMYSPHCGLENACLTWSGPEYMYNMLKFNDVDLPDEAFSVLRLFSLTDWHSKNLYDNLANDDDSEVLPFVLDFDNLQRQARHSCLREAELTDEECDRLWDSHYASIAAKFDAGSCLHW